MRTIIIISILFCTFSCSEKKESQTIDIPLEQRLEFTRLVLKETYITYNDINIGGNSKFSVHSSRIAEMIRKIETFLRRGEYKKKIDFTKDYDFFNYQKYYKVDFFKSKKLTPEEAIFVIDQLIYALRTSELGNNYFKYSTPDFNFIQTHNGDSLDFTVTPNQMLKPTSFLGPINYCDSQEYIKNHMVDLWEHKLDISKYKIGDTITGGILMRKMNYPVFVPFKYVKKKQ